jgi:hypothetical protein
MVQRLLVALLLSGVALGLLGCGSGGPPPQDTKSMKQMRPRMPQAPPTRR